MAYEALDSLRKTIQRFLEQSHHPETMRELFSIHDETYAFQFHLKNKQQNLQEEIRDAANAAEEILEYLFSEENPPWRLWNQLREAALYFKSTAVDSGQKFKDSSPSVRSSSSKDVVVGFDEDLQEIKQRLTSIGQPSKLQVLSIVGTGGIGKTTLAKLVYNHESIVRHFDIRAWVTVSQDYTVASIVSKLLASLEEGGFPVERDGQGGISMDSLIQTHLNRGRFLIVIDDVWTKKAWDDLKTLFPDTGSRSRIMLTTRLHEVADYVNSSIPVHFMRLLDAHHSWDLLNKKVFVDESCPIQLEDIGRKIVKICGGLPLSIVMVAGILSKLPKTRYSWKKYAADHGTLETVIKLSYNHIPDHMRECFLYMGGFPEDYEIRISELIKLWISEGFLKFQTRSTSLEKAAAKILDNLVERNLVIVSRRKFDGKIKSCVLHDIVRDFCIREAQREMFLLSVMDYLPTPILRRHFLPRLLKTYGRISVSSHDLDLKNYVHCSSTQSIICIPWGGYKCVSSMHKFSSLKVFHVLRRNNNWEWEPYQVLDLMDLNYLASNISIIPSTISNLKHLQTLIIYRSDVVLPVEIWKLRQLRHLMALSFDSLPQPYRETLPLEKLQVLSLVIDLMCCERMMEMIPNIKKLGIRCKSFMEALNINNLGYLRQLEKLKLVSLHKLQCNSRWKIPIFPLLLNKLTLCGTRLPWEDIRIIGSLPGLQVLKLRNYAFNGTFWETTEGEFRQLEFLLVDESHLLEWVTKSSHFPKLKSLALHRCPYLFNIPRDIGNVSTLELIKVDAGNKYLIDSAKLIQMDQEKKGNYRIQISYSNAFLSQQREVEEHTYLDHFPHHLKECSYMAAFPKNYEIRVSEIIKLWVAEGFLVSAAETKNLEEEAEDCLENLVQRGLVLVTSRKADGKIKSCRLHDMVRDFCARQAVQHKFILPVMDDFPNTIARRDFQRISVRWYDLKYSMHSSETQTIICVPQEEHMPKGSVRDFTSLRILHVLRRNGPLYWEIGEVFDHLHLTYLASNIPSNIVPPAISKLLNLQTLIIYRHEVNLPVEIWRMRRLRHLIAFSFCPLPDPEDADPALENLQSLSLATDFECSQRMVEMIPNVKKLGLCYSGLEMSRSIWARLPFVPPSPKNLSSCYHLDNLWQLHQLDKLKLEMPTSFWGSLPVFPESLKKLNLSGGGLPWSDMKIIGSLPNLQVLKLRNYACHGKEWITTREFQLPRFGEFRRLKFLLIDESNLQYWTTELMPFPCLKYLILHRCPYLSQIPSEILTHDQLELIEVDGHNQSLLDSAKRMQKKGLQVRVKRF